MPAKKKKATRKRAEKGSAKKRLRLWLMYPPKHITSPVIYELVTRFELMVNIRQAEVRDEIGIVCLELEGSREDLEMATKWLERKGIKVEPVEINVIES
jgi:ABC-type methionine transport system ATPase subunit|tara:strand:+ start:1397 stop:1693 length:297 start_codon:yes stop_codon:yes gene_type:complete